MTTTPLSMRVAVVRASATPLAMAIATSAAMTTASATAEPADRRSFPARMRCRIHLNAPSAIRGPGRVPDCRIPDLRRSGLSDECDHAEDSPRRRAAECRLGRAEQHERVVRRVAHQRARGVVLDVDAAVRDARDEGVALGLRPAARPRSAAAPPRPDRAAARLRCARCSRPRGGGSRRPRGRRPARRTRPSGRIRAGRGRTRWSAAMCETCRWTCPIVVPRAGARTAPSRGRRARPAGR